MENIINNNIDNNPRRVNRGRQRVEMVRMTNENNLQVTFSKRRAGLFKKASELCTLCGVEMTLVVFSPGKKVFSFGHPSVEAVLERYANNRRMFQDLLGGSGSGSGSRDSDDLGSGVGNGAPKLIESHGNANLEELNVRLAQVTGHLDTEKKRGEQMTKLRKANQAYCWWEKPVEKLDMEQLEKLKRSQLELKKAVHQQAKRVLIEASATVNNAGLPPIPYTLARPPPPRQPHFYPATLAGFGAHGRPSGMMVPHNNMNNVGFGSTSVVPYSGSVYNNNNNNHGRMMYLPPLPLPPSPAPPQSPRGCNNIE